MNNFIILTTALALSMDAFSVSVSKGMSINNISMYLCLKISLFFGLFQGAMTYLGWLCGISFEKYIVAVDHWIALILLSYLGFRMIKEFMNDRENKDEECLKSESSITTAEITLLALATSIDAMAVGISFVFTDISIIPTSITIAVITFMMCLSGVYLGSRVGNIFSGYANLLGGIILISIGFNIFNEHTGFVYNIMSVIQ